MIFGNTMDSNRILGNTIILKYLFNWGMQIIADNSRNIRIIDNCEQGNNRTKQIKDINLIISNLYVDKSTPRCDYREYKIRNKGGGTAKNLVKN